MNNIKIVSVDMFRTLVDADSIIENVWRALLKDRHTPELAQEYWEKADALVFAIYEDAIKRKEYVPPRAIYEQAYSELFPEIGLDFDPKEAAGILALQHASSKPFAEAGPFLDAVGRNYTICLSSDTDDDMLGPLTQLYPFDKIFTSESLGTFKTGAGGKFFSAVMDYYGVEPESIIHIGDSLSDIIGASEAGIVSCWLNRNDKTWTYEVKPDYEVRSLMEAASLLGVDVGSG